MYKERVPNLQRRNVISTAQIMQITLLVAVISADCRNDINKVDILRGENRVFLNSTVEDIFMCKDSH